MGLSAGVVLQFTVGDFRSKYRRGDFVGRVTGRGREPPVRTFRSAGVAEVPTLSVTRVSVRVLPMGRKVHRLPCIDFERTEIIVLGITRHSDSMKYIHTASYDAWKRQQHVLTQAHGAVCEVEI